MTEMGFFIKNYVAANGSLQISEYRLVGTYSILQDYLCLFVEL